MAGTVEHSFTGLGGKVEITPPAGLSGSKVAIADIIAVKPGNRKTDVVEKGVINGTSIAKKKAPTLRDDGTLTLDLSTNLEDPGQLLLSAAHEANATLLVDVTYPALPGFTTGVKKSFSAFVTSDGLGDMSLNQFSQYSVELTLDGTGITTTAAVAATGS